MMADGSMDEDGYDTRPVEGGHGLCYNGKPIGFLQGEDGALRVEPLRDTVLTDDKDKCYDDRIADSDHSLGAHKKCARKC